MKKAEIVENIKTVADPVRAKVHRNLARYAEDSLDARLREVRE
jgi:hypothetical protein